MERLNCSHESVNNDPNDVEEEEVLLYSDFDSVLNDEMFQQNALIKIIALDSDEPFLQIGTQMYSGKWTDSVGTHLFFESEASSPPLDPIFSDIPNTLLNFKYKTRKSLEFSRIFINQKENEDLEEESVNTQNESTVFADVAMYTEDNAALKNKGAHSASNEY